MNPLQNKKIELFLLDRKVSRVINDPKHVNENVMLRNTTFSFSLPAANGVWVDVFAKEAGSYLKGREMQKFLEIAIGFPENTMQTSDPHQMDFWKEHGTVSFTKTDPGVNYAVAVFDLSNPLDYVKYLVCKYNEELVAPSWNERNNKPYYLLALRDPDSENKEERNNTLKASDIIKRLSKWHDAGDASTLYTIYNLFVSNTPNYFPEHKITNTSKADDIYVALFEVVNNKRAEHISSLDRVTSKPDAELNGYRAVYEGMMYNQIILSVNGKRKSYYNAERELIGTSEIEVVNWLNSPKGSELKLIIESKRGSEPEVKTTKRK